MFFLIKCILQLDRVQKPIHISQPLGKGFDGELNRSRHNRLHGVVPLESCSVIRKKRFFIFRCVFFYNLTDCFRHDTNCRMSLWSVINTSFCETGRILHHHYWWLFFLSFLLLLLKEDILFVTGENAIQALSVETCLQFAAKAESALQTPWMTRSRNGR